MFPGPESEDWDEGGPSEATPIADEQDLFPNLFPDDSARPHDRTINPSQFLRVRGARWFDYVVLIDGSLVVGQRMIGQGHANLAQGEAVKAAGQVQVSGGQIIEVDNASGHYLPTGLAAQVSAILAFARAGFVVTEGIDVEKFWNPQNLAWEPSR